MSNESTNNAIGKISVIMGIYNCENTLRAAIDSIINQTYSNWELVMCDDASTDGTYKIAEEYKNKYSDKMVLIRNDVNSKLSFTLNHCLEYATGEFVARMDGDDISKPERFEKEIEFLISHPEYELVGCAMQRFNDDGLADIVNSVENPDYYTLKNRMPFHHATIMTYKRVYDTLGGYTVSERTRRAQDYDLWFRFYHEGYNGYNLKDPLYLVREDEISIRRRKAKDRFNSFKTTIIGFSLLNYPKRWIVRAFFETAFKSLVPYRAIELFRKIQNKVRK